jgi:hypothetical protein
MWRSGVQLCYVVKAVVTFDAEPFTLYAARAFELDAVALHSSPACPLFHGQISKIPKQSTSERKTVIFLPSAEGTAFVLSAYVLDKSQDRGRTLGIWISHKAAGKRSLQSFSFCQSHFEVRFGRLVECFACRGHGELGIGYEYRA